MAVQGLIYDVLQYGTLALALWALIDAIIRPAPAYVATGKLTKPAWVGITALAVLLLFAFSPISFFGLPAVIAAVVYLVDVRPAVRELRGGNNGW